MSSSFQDTEELSLALKHTNVRAMQSGPGPFKATLTQAAVGDWSLQFIRFQQGSSVCAGDAPPKNYAVVVPLGTNARSRLLGQQLTPRSIGVYAPGSEHADATFADCEQAVIVAPTSFAEQADKEGLCLARRGSHVMQAHPEHVARLQAILRHISHSVLQDATHCSSTQVRAELADTLSGALTDALNPSHGDERHAQGLGRPPLPRRALLKHALDVLEARQDEPLNATALAGEVGISQSSLQRAFNEWFGMPPARYITIKRLHLARQRLRERSGDTVTDVASTLGFWDLSRFARSYKGMFGELPSETLRSNGRL